MSAQYQIDYTIYQVDDDGRATEVGFGGTDRWDTIREAAYEVESQRATMSAAPTRAAVCWCGTCIGEPWLGPDGRI